MSTSRRAFIQAGAAIPAAAIAATVGSPLITATLAAPTPYVEYPWQWWVSHDGEIYRECFDTFDEAFKCAQQSEYKIVAECCQTQFCLDVSGDEILELLDGNNEDLRGNGEGIECKSEQAADLGKMVTAAIEAWVMKYNISITAWTFGGVRNRIELPKTENPPHRTSVA